MNEVNPYESPAANTSLGNDEPYEPKIFALSGRVGRGRYFLYSMIYNLLLGLIIGIIAGAFGATGVFEGEASSGFTVVIFAAYAVGLAMFLMLARRRLNDLDRAGWWGLLFIVPFINLILGLYLLFWPGTQGANRFGPPPTKSPTALIIAVAIVMIGILTSIAIPAYQEYVKRAAEIQGQIGP